MPVGALFRIPWLLLCHADNILRAIVMGAALMADDWRTERETTDRRDGAAKICDQSKIQICL